MKIKRDKDILFESDSMKWIDKYNSFIDEVRNRQSELAKEISFLDLQEQDILHYIEFKKCSAVVNAKLIKKLREIRLQRRNFKEEFCAISSICSLAKKSKYSGEKTYTYKTEIIVDLLGEKI